MEICSRRILLANLRCLKTISISIPKPCREKWESFNQTKLGGFCNGCQKEVIDFTAWSDDQIKNYFNNYQNSGCGRFNASQLKTYSVENVRPLKFRRWISSSAIALTLLLCNQRAEAQMLKKQFVNEWFLSHQDKDKSFTIPESASDEFELAALTLKESEK